MRLFGGFMESMSELFRVVGFGGRRRCVREFQV